MTPEGWLPRALNSGWSYRDRIEARSSGMPVTAFYAGRYRHSAQAEWQRRLEAGEIERNGQRLLVDLALVAGDRLAWQRSPWWEEAVPAHWTVVYDDGDLLVLDKPSGLPVLPAGGWLEHTVLRLLERRHQGDPAGIPRPVHRLGRFTSGLLVCARRPATRAWLSARLRESTAGGMAAGGGQGVAPGLVVAAGKVMDPARADAQAQDPMDHDPMAQCQKVRAAAARRDAAWEANVLDAVAQDREVQEAEARQAAVGVAWAPETGTPGGARPGWASGLRAAGVGPSPQLAGSPEGGPWAGAAAAPACRKVYRALLLPGALDLAPGESLAITTPIGRRDHPQLGQIWCAADGSRANDLAALSTLTLLERHAEADLVQVAIASGRPHQIRIHCAALGVPLLGDPLYRPGGLMAAAARPGDGGYRLQAWRLELALPAGGRLELEAPLALGV